MRVRRARYTQRFFYGCSSYPRCNHIEELKILSIPGAVEFQRTMNDDRDTWYSIGEYQDEGLYHIDDYGIFHD